MSRGCRVGGEVEVVKKGWMEISEVLMNLIGFWMDITMAIDR